MVVADQKATPFDVLPEHPGRVSAHSRRGDGYRPVMLRQVSEELGDGCIASKFLPPELLDLAGFVEILADEHQSIFLDVVKSQVSIQLSPPLVVAGIEAR